MVPNMAGVYASALAHVHRLHEKERKEHEAREVKYYKEKRVGRNLLQNVSM